MTVRFATGGLDRGLRRRHDLARGDAGRRGQARGERVGLGQPLGDHSAGRRGSPATRRTASSRVSGNVRVVGHLARDAKGRGLAALPDAHLEHPEPSVLDRELDVAEVAVVALQAVRVLAQLARDIGHPRVEARDRLGVMRPGDDVLALRVEHDVAVEGVLPGRGVAGEQDAGPRVHASVPEDHRLDRDARPEILRDPLDLSVRPGLLPHPRAEDRLDGPAELRPRVGRDVVHADDAAVLRLEPRTGSSRRTSRCRRQRRGRRSSSR